MGLIRDGGAAFPRPASEYTKQGTCPDGNVPEDAQDGMSLRDYFAGLAMQGLLANANLESDSTPIDIAEVAVDHANALLAELRKP